MLSTFLLSALLFTTYSCSSDQIVPKYSINNEEQRILSRTPDCNTDVSEQVKVKVSERDHIPLNQILTSTYYGTTTQGYCEYRLTTMFDGNKVFYVTGIIGDEVEGF